MGTVLTSEYKNRVIESETAKKLIVGHQRRH